MIKTCKKMACLDFNKIYNFLRKKMSKIKKLD